MSIRLVALDLDNTLFDKAKEVSVKNRQAILAAKAQGVKVVITTGRPLPAIGNLLNDLGLADEEDYSVTLNGGLIQSNTGQVIAETGLTLSEIKAIADILVPLGLPVDVISGDQVYSLPALGHQSLYHRANPLLTFNTITDLSELPRDRQFNKVVTVQEAAYLDQQMARLPEALGQAFEVFKSRDIILEIMPKGVHKATGLKVLSDFLGIDQSDVMAVGDEANDLSMVAWAGCGVAMANAVPALKEIAQWVTTADNNHSGVAEAIQKFVLKGDR
ncbi:Cof-type HAD-IIB family hydrolase [Streptococcus sp. DD12]|uniref:Cof-type HAD-IIB family hydrolase n=1 Tax=Streptococcus sp. DD12 TaxID=1777880 RepID=UPI000797A52E|nr:Cof-type HAD-IIB family hydrolase [Streptococcus sp. DD12]KXT76914.1 Hydrolase (HAD superfamily) [Streptococcus sp. DD12]